jgi:hypothetical protein
VFMSEGQKCTEMVRRPLLVGKDYSSPVDSVFDPDQQEWSNHVSDITAPIRTFPGHYEQVYPFPIPLSPFPFPLSPYPFPLSPLPLLPRFSFLLSLPPPTHNFFSHRQTRSRSVRLCHRVQCRRFLPTGCTVVLGQLTPRRRGICSSSTHGPKACGVLRRTCSSTRGWQSISC